MRCFFFLYWLFHLAIRKTIKIYVYENFQHVSFSFLSSDANCWDVIIFYNNKMTISKHSQCSPILTLTRNFFGKHTDFHTLEPAKNKKKRTQTHTSICCMIKYDVSIYEWSIQFHICVLCDDFGYFISAARAPVRLLCLFECFTRQRKKKTILARFLFYQNVFFSSLLSHFCCCCKNQDEWMVRQTVTYGLLYLAWMSSICFPFCSNPSSCEFALFV